MVLKCRFGWIGEALGGSDRWLGYVSVSADHGEHTVSHPQKPICVSGRCCRRSTSSRGSLHLRHRLRPPSNWQPVAQLVAAFQSEGVKSSHTFREDRPSSNFGLAHQIDSLRRGLIKGGTLDNALVCGSEGWLNRL